MAVLNTDFVPINRGGTAGDGASGSYHVTTVADILALADQLIVSTDAGQVLSTGGDGGVLLTGATIKANETVTSTVYSAATQTLTYTDESGNANNMDLSALATDLRVDGASVSAGGVITFTVNDAGTATDFTLDLSTYVSSFADNQTAGTFTVGTGGSSTVVQKTSWMSATVAP